MQHDEQLGHEEYAMMQRLEQNIGRRLARGERQAIGDLLMGNRITLSDRRLEGLQSELDEIHDWCKAHRLLDEGDWR